MKSDSLTSEKPAVEPRAHTRLGDVLTLAKLRVNALVVATTAGGYDMAGPPVVDSAALAWTCLGTTLVASGAAAINQVHERETDRLMERTRRRPVAAGRMTPLEGWTIAAALSSAAGLVMLWLTSTPAAMWVALATLVTYAGVYTPLKRRTSLATMGAVPGACCCCSSAGRPFTAPSRAWNRGPCF